MGPSQTWDERFVISKDSLPTIIIDSFYAYSGLTFTGATSEEFVPNVKKPVIVFMPEISKTHMGGTMRLGLRPTVFEPGTEKSSIARKLYAGAPTIWERHRHRYEVNPALVNELNAEGFNFVGKDEKGERMQICELESESIRFVLSKRMNTYKHLGT